MTVSSKVRIYDLAKELKLDTKRLIEEVRREGVDVSVPSNSVSKELAEKIRNKYFPKKEMAVKRAVKVVKRASMPTLEAPVLEAEPEAYEPELVDLPPPVADEPVEAPAMAAATPPAAKQPVTRLVKKLSPPPVQAEAPVAVEELSPEPVEEAEPVVEEPVFEEPVVAAPELVIPTNGAEARPVPAPVAAPVPS